MPASTSAAAAPGRGRTGSGGLTSRAATTAAAGLRRGQRNRLLLQRPPKASREELLELVASISPENPIDVTDSHKEQLDELWSRYNAASEAENPQELAKKAFEPV